MRETRELTFNTISKDPYKKDEWKIETRRAIGKREIMFKEIFIG